MSPEALVSIMKVSLEFGIANIRVVVMVCLSLLNASAAPVHIKPFFLKTGKRASQNPIVAIKFLITADQA